MSSIGTGCTWEAAVEEIRARFGHYSWVHSINNACLIMAGLLWGDGDFAATVGSDGARRLGHRLERRNGWLGRRHRAGRSQAATPFHRAASRSNPLGDLRL